jgi:hypothetical protein
MPRALLLFSLLACLAGHAQAQDPAEPPGIVGRLWTTFTTDAYGTLSIGVVQWVMDVHRPSDGARARLVQRDDRSLSIGYGSRPSFIGTSAVGYTVLANWVFFDLQKQAVPGNDFASLGTSIDGNMVYAIPALFYQWGDRKANRRFVRLGGGIGLGATSFSGTAQLSNGQVARIEESYDARLATMAFLEGRWNHFNATVTAGTPRIEGGNYDIRMSGLTARIGLVYYF